MMRNLLHGARVIAVLFLFVGCGAPPVPTTTPLPMRTSVAAPPTPSPAAEGVLTPASMPSTAVVVTTPTAPMPASPLVATATHLPPYPLPPYTTPTAGDARVPFADGASVTLRNGGAAFTLTIQGITTMTQSYGVVIHYLTFTAVMANVGSEVVNLDGDWQLLFKNGMLSVMPPAIGPRYSLAPGDTKTQVVRLSFNAPGEVPLWLHYVPNAASPRTIFFDVPSAIGDPPTPAVTSTPVSATAV